METKAKQEAKLFKNENEQLKEMMGFKEKKIADLQKEIDRLKLVIRSEADVKKSPVSQASPRMVTSKMEKK